LDIKVNKRKKGIYITFLIFTITTMISIFFPYFNLLVNIIGSFVACGMHLILPLILELKIGVNVNYAFNVIKIIALVILGVASVVCSFIIEFY